MGKISQKFQFVIPKAVRERMKLRAGMNVSAHYIDQNTAVLLKGQADSVKALRGLGKEVWQSLGGTEKYIKQERSSWDKK